MKKIVLLLFLSGSLIAQTFSVTVDHLSLSDSLNSEMIFTFQITNNSASEQTIDIIRTNNDLPDNWSSSLCFSLCFSPTVDSISTTKDFGSSPLAAAETREFTVHVFPMVNSGNASVSVKVKNAANVNEFQSFDLSASTEVTSVKYNNLPQNFTLSENYPNPFNPSTNFKLNIKKGGFGQMVLYNSAGESLGVLINEYFAAGEYVRNINLENYSSGIYFVKFTINRFNEFKKIVLEK